MTVAVAVGTGAIGAEAVGAGNPGIGNTGPKIAGGGDAAPAQGQRAVGTQGSRYSTVRPGEAASSSPSLNSGSASVSWRSLWASVNSGIAVRMQPKTQIDAEGETLKPTQNENQSAVEDPALPLSFSSLAGQRPAASSVTAPALKSALKSALKDDLPSEASPAVSASSARQASATRTTTEALVDFGNGTTNKSSVGAHSAGAAKDAHAAKDRKHLKSQAAAAKAAPAQAPAAAVSPPPAIAAPGLVPAEAAYKTVSDGEPEAAHPLLAELSFASSNGAMKGFASRAALAPGRTQTAAGTANAAEDRPASQARTAVPAGTGERTAAEGPPSAGQTVLESNGRQETQESALAGLPLAEDQAQVLAQAGGQAAANNNAAPADGRTSSRKAAVATPAVSQPASGAAVAQRPFQGSNAHPVSAATGSPARESGAAAGQHTEHIAQTQPAAATASAPAWVEAARGAQGTVNASGAQAEASGTIHADSGPQAAFAALDSAVKPDAPSWIHAGTRRAEAGFEDPALGWVGVRADLSSSGVHATLVPGSVEAAQALSGHMAGLNAYLAEHHTPVATLSMASPGDRGMSNSAGQGMNPGSGQSSGQGGSPEPSANPQPPSAATPHDVFEGTSDSRSWTGGAVPFPGRTGAYISVVV